MINRNTTLARIRIVQETDKAFLVELDSDTQKWIPKGCCKVYTKNGVKCIDIENWFYNKMFGE